MTDVVIIGAGPAGMSAGIYAARAGLKTVILEEKYAGGQITNTHLMENYPGFPDGISGAEFGERLRAQTERFGAEIRSASATGIEQNNGYRTVRTTDGDIECRAIIVAAGASPRELDIPGESRFKGEGISYCATCDGAFFRGGEVCVIGGGDTALEDALYLSNIAKRVYLIHRRQEFRAQSVLVERAQSAENIEFLLGMLPEEFFGDTHFEGVLLRNKETGEVKRLPLDGCFLAIGYRPNTEIVKGLVSLDNSGYINAGEDTRTGAKGIFAAGDIRTKRVRQVVTAVSDGAAAALAASEYIEENKRR